MENTDIRTPNPDFFYEESHIEELGKIWQNDPGFEGRRIVKIPEVDISRVGELSEAEILNTAIDKTSLGLDDIATIDEFPTQMMLPYNMGGDHWVVFTVSVDINAEEQKIVDIKFSDSLRGEHAKKVERVHAPKIQVEKDRLKQLFVATGYKASNVSVSDYEHEWKQVDESGRVEKTSCGPYIIENATRALAGAGAEANPGRMAIRSAQLNKMAIVVNMKSCSRDKEIEKILEHWAEANKTSSDRIVPNSIDDIVDKYAERYPAVNKEEVKRKFDEEWGANALRNSCERIRFHVKSKVLDSQYTPYSRAISAAIARLNNGEPARVSSSSPQSVSSPAGRAGDIASADGATRAEPGAEIAPATAAGEVPPPTYEEVMRSSFFSKYNNPASFRNMISAKLDTELDLVEPELKDVIFASAKEALLARGGELEYAPDEVREIVSELANVEALRDQLENIEDAYQIPLAMHLTAHQAAIVAPPERRTVEDALIFIGRNCKFAEDIGLAPEEIEEIFKHRREILLKEAQETDNMPLIRTLMGVDDLATFNAIAAAREEVREGIARFGSREGKLPSATAGRSRGGRRSR